MSRQNLLLKKAINRRGNSLVNYIKVKLWFESNFPTIIHDCPQESYRNLNIEFVDYVANIIWNKYERYHTAVYDILKQKVESKHLFF